MTTEPVGYRLVDEGGDVLASWGGTWGQMPGIPNPITLPNGDRIYCPEVGEPYPYGDKVARLEVWEMEEPDVPSVIAKADLWRRATEEEAEAMDAMLAAQPARVRNIYRDAVELRSDDELFPLLVGGLTELFGADRAGQILAPS